MNDPDAINANWLTLCAARLSASYADRPRWADRLAAQSADHYDRLARSHAGYVDRWTPLGLSYASDLICAELYRTLAAVARRDAYGARVAAAETVAALYRTLDALEDRLALARAAWTTKEAEL